MENEEESNVSPEHISSENNASSEHLSSETAEELDEASEIANLKKVEAALFLSARFLKLQDLVMLTDINPLMIRELIEKLIEKYNSDNSAIEIVVKEDMWKMDIGEEYVSMVNKLATGSAEFTKAEQETLAVIAYKQPVKQSVIIKIRGNKSYEHIKHFIEIGLVQAKKAGRTKELRLSDDFYEYFHLQKKGDGSAELVIESTNEVVADIDNNDVEKIEEAVKEVDAEDRMETKVSLTSHPSLDGGGEMNEEGEEEEEGELEEGSEIEQGDVVEEGEEVSSEEKHEAIKEEKEGEN